MEPLTQCMRLSTLALYVECPHSKSWQDFVTTLHNIILHILSPRIQKLRLIFNFKSSDTRSELTFTDSVLRNVALDPIYSTTRNSRFNPLLDVTISLGSFSNHRDYFMMKDIKLTNKELAHQLRFLLQPWDKRGMLTFTNQYGYPLQADPGEIG